MRTGIFKISLAISILSLLSISCIDKNSPVSENNGTSISKEDVAMNEQVEKIVNQPDFPEFIYEIAPRFNPIKKEDLHNARTFRDIIGEEDAQKIVSYNQLSVILLDGDKQTLTKEAGKASKFTTAQVDLLQSFDHSTNLLIWAKYQDMSESGAIFEEDWPHYLTIVPEKQAEYEGGMEALKYFLDKNSAEKTSGIPEDQLQAAKLFFTVTKDGTIDNIYLDRSSGFRDIDLMMFTLIKEAPGNWTPAENSKGEPVDQELVVSFGLKGC
jgi:hypothetical protein